MKTLWIVFLFFVVLPDEFLHGAEHVIPLIVLSQEDAFCTAPSRHTHTVRFGHHPFKKIRSGH